MVADPQLAPGRRSTGPATLQVDADLTISTTTAAGDVAVGRLSGHGDTVTLQFERPDLMGAGLDRRAVGRIADGLAAGGLSVRVVGARGPLAVLGRAGGGRVGKFATGSAHVSVVPRPGVVAAAWATSGPSTRRLGWAALVGLGLGGLAAALRRRGRGTA